MSDDADGTDDSGGRTRSAVRVLAANRRRLAVDAVVVAAWTVLLLGVVTRLGWPRWMYYAVLLLGVVVYTVTFGSLRAPGDRR